MRVVAAMSGGVDSSVAAALALADGHEVVGMTMRLADVGEAARTGACCAPAEIDRARRVCSLLGIPHYTLDERDLFERAVVDDFVRTYAAGRTPNPCTRCNQHVKFGPLLRRAVAIGAEALITGHYARNHGGALLRAVDRDKDQSYFLFAMGGAALERVRFPLGDLRKAEVRAHARSLGLPNADTPDSQELCFAPDGDHAAVVEHRAAALGLDAVRLRPGEVVDLDGRVIGTHAGIHRVTVGQRRGLRVAGTERRYVLRVVPELARVVVDDAARRGAIGCEVGELQRLGLPAVGSVRSEVQVRHRGVASPATIHVDGDRARVVFDAPVEAVAPGQAAVFFSGDRVLGGGWIGAVELAAPAAIDFGPEAD